MLLPEHYARCRELSNIYGKELVVFDLEHTGGPKGARGITEFGAVVLGPGGIEQEYLSLVRPDESAIFNPYATRVTGITRETVADAPPWEAVLHEFVLPRTDAIWVGFNSSSCDMPIMHDECSRVGLEFTVGTHLDLMRLGGSGTLSRRVQEAYPHVDISGAHRALQDAAFTLMLMDWMLAQGYPVRESIDGTFGRSRQRTSWSGSGGRSRRADVQQDIILPVEPGTSRQGHSWPENEVQWVHRRFLEGASLEEVAEEVGRTAFAVACNLHKNGHIDEHERDAYRPGASLSM